MRSFVPITPLGSEFLKPIFVGEVITCHPADDDATQSRLGTWPPAQFSTRGDHSCRGVSARARGQ